MDPSSRMTVLITGACGLLGSHLMAALSGHYRVVGIDRNPWWGDEPLEVVQADLQEPRVLQRLVSMIAPRIVIHCAALANVDACEQNPALAYAVNTHMTRDLVCSLPSGCRVVYISTDGVFKGNKPFVTEEDLPCPRTVYGRSKVQAEWEVMLGTEDHLIVRTNFYGWSSGRKQTSGEWLYTSLASQQPFVLFRDFFFTPIYVVDFVKRLILLLESDYRGIIHLGGRDRLSKYQFGLLLAQAAGLSTQHVREGSIDEVPLIASRPKDMSLKSERFVQLTGLDVPDTVSGVRRFVADRLRPLRLRFTATEMETTQSYQ